MELTVAIPGKRF